MLIIPETKETGPKLVSITISEVLRIYELFLYFPFLFLPFALTVLRLQDIKRADYFLEDVLRDEDWAQAFYTPGGWLAGIRDAEEH